MVQNQSRKRLTDEEKRRIFELKVKGYSYKEIAEKENRSIHTVNHLIQREFKQYKEDKNKTPIENFTPRELIKRLHDLGYRIKNNKLVQIREIEVNLKDIINN